MTRRERKKELEDIYDRKHFIIDITVISATLISFGLLILGIAHADTPYEGVVIVVSLILGLATADFISGLGHWSFDTWGRVDMPIIGKMFIGPFRQHHLFPRAITEHHLIQLLGNTAVVTLPVVIGGNLITPSPGWGFFWSSFVLFLGMGMLLTNLFHKWAHSAKRPLPVRILQRLHLILPPEDHNVHHVMPFNQYYCITTGWMNYPLSRIGFFVFLEKIITKTTGSIPRHDDLGLAAAKRLARKERIL